MSVTPLVNDTPPVESHLLLFMNDHKRLGFDFNRNTAK
jgi:hypothetical protein